MEPYLIVLASSTAAFKAKKVLRANGISAQVLKTPMQYSKNGCSHSVRVGQTDVEHATQILTRAHLGLQQVVRQRPD